MVIIALVFLSIILMSAAIIFEARLMRLLWAARKTSHPVLHWSGQFLLTGAMLYSLFSLIYTAIHIILSVVKPEYFDQKDVLATAMLGWIGIIILNSILLLWLVPLHTWVTRARMMPTRGMKAKTIIQSLIVTALLCCLLILGIVDFFRGDAGFLIKINYWPK